MRKQLYMKLVIMFKSRRLKRKILMVIAIFLLFMWFINPFQISQVIVIPSNIKEYSSYDQLVIISQRYGLETDKLKVKNQTNAQWDYKSVSNLHIWNEVCDYRIEKILTYPIFPHLPSHKKLVEKLELNSLTANAGFRLFGFLIVSNSSQYHLQVKSKHVSVLVWLSKTELPTDMELLINVTKTSTLSIEHTKKRFIVTKRYFFDIIIKTEDIIGEFSLSIKTDSETEYKIVDKQYLRAYDFSIFYEDDINEMYMANKNLTIISNKKTLQELHIGDADLKRSESYKIPHLPLEKTKDLMPSCVYNPSYIVKRRLNYKQGVWETQYMSIFPNDYTDHVYHHVEYGFDQISYGNDILNEMVVDKIVGNVMLAINQKHKESPYRLISVINIERVKDIQKGDRYLVELELSEVKSNELSLFSEFVYQPISGNLCYPKMFRPNYKAHVNVILAVKNQGRWIRHLIDTFSQIYKETKDTAFTLIIVDFNSNDVHIEKILEESYIPNYMFLRHDASFYKTFGLQAAAAKVTSPNEIVLQVDLHLTIPVDFLQIVRKHTVQGKSAFCPSVFRLQCGATPQYPNGYWETSGYGIFAVYKSDWETFGGMNVEKFYNHWGGEDWDLLDRVLSAGYEVERMKLQNFNHVYHSKAGMWNQAKS